MKAELLALYCAFFLFSKQEEKDRLEKIILSTDGYNRFKSLSELNLESFFEAFRPFVISEEEWKILKKGYPGATKAAFEDKNNRLKEYHKKSWFDYFEKGGEKPKDE